MAAKLLADLLASMPNIGLDSATSSVSSTSSTISSLSNMVAVSSEMTD